MKILTAEQTREADAYTIKNEPISSEALMERAAGKCFEWIRLHFGRNKKFSIFCGPGNNGGDGLVIARMMANKNIKSQVYYVNTGGNFSKDFTLNIEKLRKINKYPILEISSSNQIPELDSEDIIIDALLGSGLNKPITDGIFLELAKTINASKNTVIAIDIPSGLFGEENDKAGGICLRATHTLTFEFPKLAFMFPENEPNVGDWQVLPIGLDKNFITNCPSDWFYLESTDCAVLLHQRSRFSHKGTYGHSLLICGSFGKMGAAVLSSRACLSAGAGLVTAHAPQTGYDIMQTAVPEVMCSVDENEFCFSQHFMNLTFDAIGVGCGIGTEAITQQALKILIQNYRKPLVIDADAINILSENKTWISFLPAGSILTPHHKEFERLSGRSWSNSYDRLQIQKEISVKNNIYIVFKGANSCITTPTGKCYYNSSGNPGMATAGSGDVLCGIITGLLSQGYSSFESAVLGTHLHGLSGDLAAKYHGYEALTASHLINFLGKAFKKLHL